MAFCKKCGSELDADALYCPECGASVTKTKPSSKTQAESPQENNGQTIQRDGPVYGVVNLEKLPAGHIIDERYEIKEKLGQGGFGAVYRAFDKKMNVDKALKIIPEAVTNDLRAMTNLRQEAQTMIRLNHNNLVRMYDFQESGAVKYIDMEYIDGKSLNELLLDFPDQKMPEEKVKKIALQISEGLIYAHKQNVIHRDIKPQNIMLSRDGQIKIMDFGIAETLRNSMSMIQNSGTTGTLMYMSPEQLMGGEVRKTSDIYSFGVTLYEMLNSKPPFFSGDITYQILNVQAEPLEKVSDKMNNILLCCLKKDHKERYNNFNEIIDAFDGKDKRSVIVEPKENIKTGAYHRLAKASIYIEPSGAKVWINSRLMDEKKLKDIKLPAGDNTIKIQKKGYATIIEKFYISLSKNNDFLFELKSINGEIQINCAKPDLEIILNGRKTGKIAPSTIGELNPGNYVISLIGEEYFSKEVKINLKEESAEFVEPLLFEYGYFTFHSQYNVQFINDELAIEKDKKIKIKADHYRLTPSIEYLPELEIDIKYGQHLEIDYDENIPLRTIEFDAGKYKVNGLLSNIDNNYKKEIKIEKNHSISVLPGNYNFVSKFITPWKKEQLKINVYENDQVVDLKGMHKKNRIKCLKIIIIIILLLIIGCLLMSGIAEKRKQEQAARLKLMTGTMVYVKGGTLQMGSNDYSDEKPVHSVKINSFYIGKYEVTQKQWQAVMGSNPSKWKGSNLPVENVSWNDIQGFLRKLNAKTSGGFRLPTEAEWEYAARGGSRSANYKYSGSNTAGDVAWYSSNSGSKTHTVGQKRGNELGLYDMSGNIWEWCSDWYGSNYYNNSPSNSPTGPKFGSGRVLRGGGWYNRSLGVRTANRFDGHPGRHLDGYGFRLAKTR